MWRGHDRPWPPGLRNDGARKGQQRRNGNDDAAVEKQTHQEYLSRVTILRTPWPVSGDLHGRPQVIRANTSVDPGVSHECQ
jgi:hypothetical protein